MRPLKQYRAAEPHTIVGQFCAKLGADPSEALWQVITPPWYCNVPHEFENCIVQIIHDDLDDAPGIRSLFPKQGQEWCGIQRLVLLTKSQED